MGLSGLHTLSFYDNNDGGNFFSGGNTPTAGTAVQINDIKDDEGEIVVGKPFAENKRPNGEIVFSGTENHLEVAVYEDNIVSQIKQWQKMQLEDMTSPGLPIQCVGAGFGENLQWYEPTKVRILPKNFLAPGNRNFRIIKMDFEGGEADIYQNINLLAFLGWKDADNDGLADGYGVFNSDNETFVTGGQKIEETSSNSTLGLFVDLKFPISNIKLTLSSFLQLPYDGDGDDRIIIDSRDFSNSLISSNDVITNNDLNSIGLPMPSNSYFARVQPLAVNQIATNGKTRVSNPALTTNGRLTPGTQFMNF